MSKRLLKGTVVNNNMDKTIKVKVERGYIHPIFKKVVRRTKNYLAHDPKNMCNIGDFVLVKECRPLSKNKSYILDTIITKKEVSS